MKFLENENNDSREIDVFCRWCQASDGRHDGATHDAYAEDSPAGVGYNGNFRKNLNL